MYHRPAKPKNISFAYSILFTLRWIDPEYQDYHFQAAIDFQNLWN